MTNISRFIDTILVVYNTILIIVMLRETFRMQHFFKFFKMIRTLRGVIIKNIYSNIKKNRKRTTKHSLFCLFRFLLFCFGYLKKCNVSFAQLKTK